VFQKVDDALLRAVDAGVMWAWNECGISWRALDRQVRIGLVVYSAFWYADFEHGFKNLGLLWMWPLVAATQWWIQHTHDSTTLEMLAARNMWRRGVAFLRAFRWIWIGIGLIDILAGQWAGALWWALFVLSDLIGDAIVPTKPRRKKPAKAKAPAFGAILQPARF